MLSNKSADKVREILNLFWRIDYDSRKSF